MAPARCFSRGSSITSSRPSPSCERRPESSGSPAWARGSRWPSNPGPTAGRPVPVAEGGAPAPTGFLPGDSNSSCRRTPPRSSSTRGGGWTARDAADEEGGEWPAVSPGLDPRAVPGPGHDLGRRRRRIRWQGETDHQQGLRLRTRQGIESAVYHTLGSLTEPRLAADSAGEAAGLRRPAAFTPAVSSLAAHDPGADRLPRHRSVLLCGSHQPWPQTTRNRYPRSPTSSGSTISRPIRTAGFRPTT